MLEKFSELKSIYRFPRVVVPVQSLRQVLSCLFAGAMFGLVFEVFDMILGSSVFSIKGIFISAAVWGYVLIFIENPAFFTISSDQFGGKDWAKMIDERLHLIGYEVERSSEVAAINFRYRRHAKIRLLDKIFLIEENDIFLVTNEDSIEVRGPLLTLHEFRKKLINAPLRFTVPQP